MKLSHWGRCLSFVTLVLQATLPAQAQDQAQTQSLTAAQTAQIRQTLTERLPTLPRIEEIRRTPMTGLLELRTENNEIYYSDAEAKYLIQGQLLDTAQRRNLTEDRLEAINVIDFSKLPTKDAFTVVNGNGKRKLAVFVDPNCGYCKRFERDLEKVENVTIHVFLIPVLGKDSVEKSKNIWCAKDRSKTWQDWMLRNQLPASASCDTAAIDRNLDFSRKNRITGTPTSFTSNGTRITGAVPLAKLEQQL
jgi:thiol:disulfide interchange protein DsbC